MKNSHNVIPVLGIPISKITCPGRTEHGRRGMTGEQRQLILFAAGGGEGKGGVRYTYQTRRRYQVQVERA